MLKTISAALLAVSVLAAPAMAAGIDKTAPAPVKDSVRAKTAHAPVIKAVQVKKTVLNANARMDRHHIHHHFHRHFHKHMGANKPHQFSKVQSSTLRPPSSAADMDPRVRLVPHCPSVSADFRPGPYAIASPMAAGRCCF